MTIISHPNEENPDILTQWPSWFRRQPIVVQSVRCPSVHPVDDRSLGIRATSDGGGGMGQGPAGQGKQPGDPAGPRPPGRLPAGFVGAFRSISRQYDGPTGRVYIDVINHVCDSRPSSASSMRRVTPVPMPVSDEDLSLWCLVSENRSNCGLDSQISFKFTTRLDGWLSITRKETRPNLDHCKVQTSTNWLRSTLV